MFASGTLMRRATLVVAVLAALAASVRSAIGNSTEVAFDGAAIFPVDESRVRLVSESVDLDFRSYPERNARCVYHLLNLSGDSLRFAMAFVTPGAADLLHDESGEDRYQNMKFEVAQDGMGRASRFVRARAGVFKQLFGAPQDSFPVWDLTLAPNAASEVAIRYKATITGDCESSCWSQLRYLTRPAALWAGPCESSLFRVHLGGPGFSKRFLHPDAPWSMSVSPRGWRWTDDGVEWRFRDWKPDSDLCLDFEWPGGSDWNEPAWDPFASDSESALPAVTRGLDRVAALLKPVDVSGGHYWTGDHGRLKFRVKVEVDGRASRCRVLSPFERRLTPDWQYAAIQILLAARYRPALLHGEAVPSWVDIPIRMTMPGTAR